MLPEPSPNWPSRGQLVIPGAFPDKDDATTSTTLASPPAATSFATLQQQRSGDDGATPSRPEHSYSEWQLDWKLRVEAGCDVRDAVVADSAADMSSTDASILGHACMEAQQAIHQEVKSAKPNTHNRRTQLDRDPSPILVRLFHLHEAGLCVTVLRSRGQEGEMSQFMNYSNFLLTSQQVVRFEGAWMLESSAEIQTHKYKQMGKALPIKSRSPTEAGEDPAEESHQYHSLDLFGAIHYDIRCLIFDYVAMWPLCWQDARLCLVVCCRTIDHPQRSFTRKISFSLLPYHTYDSHVEAIVVGPSNV
ncbi:uncharacterized protein LTR77_003252 [Saxophila tyrrhenica]|uniref:Uncharacterized protein n=1 Tax=Saxophila tyrrhenica TaxID=1690608 RepID=A0AAV9PLH0_9PEZI|nr:hypothetical protein LTR77_003252 [Saxophila tyrrhenica]